MKKKDTLEDGFIPHVPNDTLLNFMAGSLHPFRHSQSLLTNLMNCSGVEIEAKEINLGILITPKVEGSVIARLDDAAIFASFHKSVEGKLKLKDVQLEDVRATLHIMRDLVFGWTPGKFEQAVLVLDSDLSVTNVKLLSAKDTEQHNAHDAYKFLTRECPDTIAVWLKPSSSIRFYAKGRLICHLMRLRDAGGWAARNLKKLADYIIRTEAARKSLDRDLSCLQDSRLIEEKILYPLIEISEEKQGASVYVFHHSDWDRLVAEGKKVQHRGHPIDGTLETIRHRELMSYLLQDGSVVIDGTGKLLHVGTYFDGKGGRKSIAMDMSKKYGASVFVSSQDGPIYYFSTNIPDADRHNRIELEESPQQNPYIRLDFFPTPDLTSAS